MKNTHLLFLCSFVLISCSNINSNVIKKDFKAGLSNLCSEPDKNLNQYTEVVKAPDVVMESFKPPKEDLKQIESTSAISIYDIALLKDNMFVAAYVYPEYDENKLVGKIFNQSGEEIVNRFEITNAYNFKVITNKNLDHFFVVYEKKDEQKDYNNLFIKKFDLKGNKLNEIKIEDNYYGNQIKNISFSFDESGSNLILSWVNLEYSYTLLPEPCPLFQTCLITHRVPPKYYHPVVKIAKFDDKMNYCMTRVGFDEELESNFNLSEPYINPKRDKLIFPLSYEKIAQVDLKDNNLKTVYLASNLIDAKNGFYYAGPITVNEDDNHDLYFASNSFIYKTDSTLKIITSKIVDGVQGIEIDKYNEGQEIDPNRFENKRLRYSFNKQLDIFRYKTDSSSIKDFTLKLGDKFLVVGRYSYFKIVDSL